MSRHALIGQSSYNLYNDSCIKVMQDLERESIGLIVTDPPYKLSSGGISGLCTNGIFHPSVYDNSGKLFNVPKFSEWVGLAYDVLERDSELYVMVNDKNLHEMLTVAAKVGFKLHNILVWDKANQTPNRWYMKRCEFILYFWKGKAKKINNMGTSSLLSVPCKMGNRIHPTEKPVDLIRIFIDNSTSESTVVLDPFMGAGSTGVACAQSGRRFIGIELDTNYFNTAKERIQSAYSKGKFIGPLFSNHPSD